MGGSVSGIPGGRPANRVPVLVIVRSVALSPCLQQDSRAATLTGQMASMWLQLAEPVAVRRTIPTFGCMLVP
jgi:hypothetical protein